MARVVRSLAALLVVAAALAAAAQLPHYAGARAGGLSITCGVERWAVKTLADDARKVDFHPQRTSVAVLRQLTRTRGSARGPGVERTTYRISALLVEAKLEGDEDYHLVVADPRHPKQTMIVEFPSSGCTKGGLKRVQMRRARAAFERACGQPSASSFTPLRGRATITGVGFFDFYHHQRGVAPNAIELHPILAFERARCRR